MGWVCFTATSSNCKLLQAHSSVKLHQFTCSRRYAMDNPDGPQSIHPSSISASIFTIQLSWSGGLGDEKLSWQKRCLHATYGLFYHPLPLFKHSFGSQWLWSSFLYVVCYGGVC